MDTRENENNCCECCHCKKIFMLFVLLILSFIAGIMVGNCQNYDPSYIYYYSTPAHINARNLHRGMHQIPNKNNSTQPDSNAQVGGFVMEVESQN